MAVISVDSPGFFYSQNFSMLPSTGSELIWVDNETIPGWFRDYWASSGATAPPFRDVSIQATDAANSGVSTQDGFINVGLDGSVDRTLVMRRNFSFYGAFGAVFQNNTDLPIVGFEAGYTGEQWRRQGDGLATSLYFEYAVMPSIESLEIASNPENWNRVDLLEFVSPNISGANTALNGKLAHNRVGLNPVLVETTIPSGHYLVVRWYQDRTRSDGSETSDARHALGVSNMSVSMIFEGARLWDGFPLVRGWRDIGHAFVDDSRFPYVFHSKLGWIYVYPHSTLGNLYVFSFANNSPVWIHHESGQYYDFSSKAWAGIHGQSNESVFPFEPIHDRSTPQNPVPEPMVLVFEDNFEGESLDWDIWGSEQYEDGLKRETARGPDNIEVADGRLRLHVRKEARDIGGGRMSEWTAGFVYVKEPVPYNTYLEARLRPGDSTGVNNAFWMAVITGDRTNWRDRYEIDIVETRRRHNQPELGSVHMAWHDWKTRGYAVNSQGNIDHIAQGFGLTHLWGQYDIWGLWYGENEFIFYLNGEEVWRGTTHSVYHDQWETGVGKLDQWFPDEEMRAYGRFGQETWRYYGGYTGDRMNVIFANLPWEASWSPLTEDADGTWMSVDYLRVYRPLRLVSSEPDTRLEGPDLVPEATLNLPEPLPLQDALQVYAALHFSRDEDSVVELELLGDDGAILGKVGSAEDGSLFLTLGEGSASSNESWPASETLVLPGPGITELVLVLRLTPDRDGTAPLLSASLYPAAGVPAAEPYLYHNTDLNGNTSMNQGWHLACKAPIEGSWGSLKLKRADGVSPRSLRIGQSFRSVVGE